MKLSEQIQEKLIIYTRNILCLNIKKCVQMLEDGESRLLYGKILRISSLFNAMLEIKVQEPLNCMYV